MRLLLGHPPHRRCRLHKRSFSTTNTADLFCELLLRPNLSLHTSDLERSLSLILTSSQSPLHSSTVDTVLRRCSTSPLPSLRFFVWAGLQSPYRHSPASYATASNNLLHRNPRAISHLLDTYSHRGCIPTSSPARAFRILLDLCRRGRLPEEAVAVLRRMGEFGCRPDTVCYNAALRSAAECGGDAEGILQEMAMGGSRPDVVTYVALVRGLCAAGRFARARELVRGMRVHGCAPTVVVYSALVDGACISGEVDAAMELVGEMEEGGEGGPPNVVTYTCLMKCLCENGRVREALGVLERMLGRGYRPNRATVSTLLKALCGEGRVDEAYDLVEGLVVGRNVMSQEAYSLLVVCLLTSGGHQEEAERLVGRMLESGVGLDRLSRNLLVRFLCSKGLFGDGFRWVHLFLKEGLGLDSDVYSILAMGLLKGGLTDEAASVVGWARERRVPLQHPHLAALGEEEPKERSDCKYPSVPGNEDL